MIFSTTKWLPLSSIHKPASLGMTQANFGIHKATCGKCRLLAYMPIAHHCGQEKRDTTTRQACAACLAERLGCLNMPLCLAAMSFGHVRHLYLPQVDAICKPVTREILQLSLSLKPKP